MSQAQAKASRRLIRRAFGPEALDTLNRQGEAILSTINDLNALAADHASLKQDIKTAGTKLNERLRSERDTADTRYVVCVGHDAILSRGFFGRLHWLVTGR